jgi:hypothetical protein
MLKQVGKSGVRVPRSRVLPTFPWTFSVALCCSFILASCGGGSKPPATLQSIGISPQSQTVAAGLTQQYNAIGIYSDGTSGPLTSVTWATSNTAVATVSTSGLATGVKQGTATISAASGTVTGSTSLAVGPPNLVSISVAPQSPSIPAGQTQQFTATGSYTDGSTQNLSSVTWSSGTTSVATISTAGLATAVTTGTSVIEAADGSIVGSTTLTVAPSLLPPVSYILGSTFASGGTNPEGVVVADFNGDGKLDIAVSNENSNTIDVFLNDGTGNFGAPITTNVQNTTWLGSIAVGDFNGDGKPDLVLAANGAESLILLGNGDGTFSQQPAVTNAPGFLQAKVVDLNGDGHLDLVLACDGLIAVALGKGDGTFQAATSLPGGSLPGAYFSLAVADFNGDGNLDVVATDFGNSLGTLDFWAGNGDGTFATATSASVNLSYPGSVAAGDFNGNGKQDVLIGYPTAATIAFGNGNGTFNLALADLETVYVNGLNTTKNGVTVFATPLTSDGKVDAVTSDFSSGTLQIALNAALGQIPPAAGIFSFPLSPGISVIAAGDLNGDGFLDVVVINYQTSEITTVLSKAQ